MKESKDMSVYLAGYITDSVIDECVAWRKRLREVYDDWKGMGRYPICWLDPLNGEDYSEISHEGLKGVLPANAIVHKDYMCVKNADLIVANMNTFGQTRPPIGTICELAWAFEFHKPIVMITTDKNYINHPFMSYFTSWYVSSVDELIDKKVINQFYKAWSTAIY